MTDPTPPLPLSSLITTAPVCHDAARAADELTDLSKRAASEPDLAGLETLLVLPKVDALLRGIIGCSPYLTGLITRRPQALLAVLTSTPDDHFAALTATLDAATATATNHAEAMRALRHYKADVALLIALADCGDVWPIMTVTRRLAEAADAAVSAAVRYLFRQAQTRGDWLDTEPDPAAHSGYIVIAMGKHGAFELNYSSDIDLIVFYEPEKARVSERHEVQTFLVRLTRDLVKLMQERTEDGYVFRTDLRLRRMPARRPLRSRRPPRCSITRASARTGSARR